jgi:hypothetical protein
MAAAAVSAPDAMAAIGQPAVTLTPSSATAGSIANLGTDITFNPSSGDTAKDLTLALPPGLIANAGIDGGACLKSSTPATACQVGTGTVTATASFLGIPAKTALSATFDLVAPPGAADLAGLAVLVKDPFSGKPTQLGTPAAITLRSGSDPAGIGLDIVFTSIPNTFDGFSISLDEINSTFDGLRFPATCPSTPASVVVTADSYSDATPQTGSAPLTVTGCSALPYAPAFTVTATRDASDQGVGLTTDVTQAAGQAPSRSVSLAFPPSVLAPNLSVIGALCSDPASGTCTPVGSASSTSPVYPAPLSGKAYLTGSVLAPSLTLVFPAPFSLTLSGTVNLGTDSTTFTGLPDIPLTDLAVTLNGGANSVFEASCTNSRGTASATLTSQNGDQTKAVSAPFTVSGCDTLVGGGTRTTKPPLGAKPQIHAVALSGLAGGKPALLFQLVAGRNAAKLSSFTIELPRGLSFVRHRVRSVLTVQGVSVTGAAIKSLALSRGHLVVRLRKPVSSLILSASNRALRETGGLRSQARHNRLTRLKLSVIVADAAGHSTTLPVVLTHLSTKKK